MKKLVHNKTSVVNINYHLIWCSKYRRKVLVNGIDQKLKEVLKDIAKKIQCSVKDIEVMPDHIHIFLQATPILPIHLIVKQLKGESSRLLRQAFPALNSRLPCLWTRSYYCETIGCISEVAVKKYIENQKKINNKE